MRDTDPYVRASLTFATSDVWVSLRRVRELRRQETGGDGDVLDDVIVSLERVAFRNLRLLTGSDELARQATAMLSDGRSVDDALRLIAEREAWVR